MEKKLSSLCISIIFCCLFNTLKSQDLIVKTNGDTISAKLLEVGLNAVSYKRTSSPDGPVFVLDKTEIVLIKYANGEVEHFNNLPATKSTTATSTTTSNASATSGTNAARQQSLASQDKNKIEFISDQYMINGQKAKRKDVDRYLSKSKNPAILVGLKATKATTLAQKITKITSIPTAIVGSFTTLFTLAEGYQLVQRGRATTRTFVDIGLSFVGTLALPVTNKILKKKSDKMYDNLIDMYNITN
jgi:hypothetical protein